MEEESMATMTPEEREQYQKEMAEKFGKQRGEGGQDVIRATGVDGPTYAYGTTERPDPQATVTAIEEEARRREKDRREEAERERERLEKERLDKEAERERKLQEWIESEKRR